MSHVTTCTLSVKDLTALEAAAESLGMKLVQNQKTFRWYGHHVGDYPLPPGFTKEDMGKCDHALVIPGDAKAYECGVVRRRDGKDGFILMYDFFAGGYGLMKAIGKDANRVRASYAEAVSMSQLRAAGRRVQRTVTATGKVVLRATRVLIAFAALWLVSCSDKNIITALTPCSDDYETAALVGLRDRFRGMNEVSQYINNFSQEDIERECAKIADTRVWVATLTDPCARKAYTGWLDWYADGAAAAERELKTGRERKSMDEYHKNTAAQYRRAKAINIPTPPKG